MEDQLVSFETAKLAKLKGFNETTGKFWGKINQSDIEYIINKDYCTHKWNSLNKPIWAAPTQSLLQRWLREVHKIEIIIKPWTGDILGSKLYAADVCMFRSRIYVKTKRIDSYEHALEIGLQEALKLIK